MNIDQEVKDLLIAKFDVDKDADPQPADTLSDLGLTFPAQVDLIDKLERKFNTYITPKEVSAVKTYGDVVALIKRKVAMQGKPHDANERIRD